MLNATALETQILELYAQELAGAFPDVLKGVEIERVSREDGTEQITVVERRGPIEVDANKLRPLARAIAQAVVQHLVTHGEAVDPAGVANWRLR